MKRKHPSIQISIRTSLPLQVLFVTKNKNLPFSELSVNSDAVPVCLCCIDMDGKVYTDRGVFDGHRNIPDILKTAFKIKSELGWTDPGLKPLFISHTKAEMLNLPNQFSGSPDFSLKEWLRINRVQISSSTGGLSSMHPHFSKYLQGDCMFYTLAISERLGLQGIWVTGEGYSHALSLHPDGTVEDIWGKRPLATYCKSIARQHGDIPLHLDLFGEEFKKCIHYKIKEVGIKDFANSLSEASRVAALNPQSSMFKGRSFPEIETLAPKDPKTRMINWLLRVMS